MSLTCLLGFLISVCVIIFVRYAPLSSQPNLVQFDYQSPQQLSRFRKYEEDYSCEECPESLIHKEFDLISVKATSFVDFFELHSCWCREVKKGELLFENFIFF